MRDQVPAVRRMEFQRGVRSADAGMVDVVADAPIDAFPKQ